ncbi:hypothetical protein [Paracoccus sp. (in: a-proteobacteria)]|nr:hypothetical protein [Paracoccus sp. (in: a-proteobacteria)]
MTRFVAITQLSGNQARILPAAMLDRFFDNRDPREWSVPVEITQQG